MLSEQTNWSILGLALVSHLAFNRFEPQSVRFIGCWLAGTASFAAFLHSHEELPVGKSALYATQGGLLYLVALGVSIATYRNSPLHPLYHFPGPRLAATTQLWFFYHNLIGTPRLALSKVHAKYGDFVRIGPNELSINNVDAVTPIHGASGWPKTYSYQVGLLTAADNQADANLLSQRFHGAHQARRKIWDKGFSSRALADYAPLIMKRNQELIQRLSERTDKPVDMHRWAGYFVYDMMSDLAFGGGFDLLAKGEDPVGLLPVIVLANSLHGLIDSLTWLKAIFELLPSSAAIDRVFKFSRGRFEDRKAKGSSSGVKDVFHYLMAEDDETGKPLPHEVLAKESQLIVGAGSDTTRTTLTLGMLFLIQNQDIYKRLQAEIDSILKNESLSVNAIDKAPLLNAVVNESLRLLPPITSGVKRESPGAMICNRFVPAGVAVRTPNYTLSHDARYFSPSPDAFRPDRWLEPKKETAFNRTAFFPFMLGPFGCIGKTVALHELRLTIASIVATFDAAFASDFDIADFHHHTRDRFVAEFDKEMRVVFTKRNGVDHGIAEAAL